MEERKKFWEQKSFLVWAIAAVSIILLVLTVALIILPEGLAVIPVIFTSLGLALWLKRCLKQIGTPEIPSSGVLARFGKAVDAMPPGLYFQLWPFERFKEFPTGQYEMIFRISEGLYSKEEGKFASQPMDAEVAVYMRFPRADRNYLFPKKVKGATKWKVTSGKDLLFHAYYRLPTPNPMKTSVEDLGKFFESTVMGGVRHILSSYNSSGCKEKHDLIEEELKDYLLTEEGNPFFECGIPKEGLDLEIRKLKFSREMEQAWVKPEISLKNAEAAEHEKVVITKKLEAYLDKGVPPEIAALQAGGIEGKAMTFDQLRDLAIFRAVGGEFQKTKKGKP